MPDINDSTTYIWGYEKNQDKFIHTQNTIDEEYCPETPIIEISPSAFWGQQSKLICASNAESKMYRKYSRDTKNAIVLVSLIVYFFIMIAVKSSISKILHASFLSNSRNINSENTQASLKYTKNILSVMSAFNITLFSILIYENIFDKIKIHQYPLLILFIATTLYFYQIVKRYITKIMCIFSDEKQLGEKINVIQTVFFCSYGLFATPFLIAANIAGYNGSKVWLTIVFVIIILLYLIKLIRLILIFIGEKISTLFMILYLCTVEILPIWIIIDYLLTK